MEKNNNLKKQLMASAIFGLFLALLVIITRQFMDNPILVVGMIVLSWNLYYVVKFKWHGYKRLFLEKGKYREAFVVYNIFGVAMFIVSLVDLYNKN